MSHKKFWLAFVLALFPLFFTSRPLVAQTTSNQLAATMEVLSPGVEVKRVDTANWIAVKKEAIVGVGDTIRTDTTGRAKITFFADGTESELQPSTEYRIDQFEGTTDSFTLNVNVLAGQTTQRLSRLLNASSSYNVQTPGLTMIARGTEFAVRVETSGRSAMLVTKGKVAASNPQSSSDVPVGFGIRAAVGADLSDVVKASTFAELDAAIDGCAVTVRTQDDMRFNVRTGPGLQFPRIGTIAPAEITTVNRVVGVNTSGNWYRIEFRSGYGWFQATTASVAQDCVGLRKFADTYGPEDSSGYTSTGDEIPRDSLTTPVEVTPETTATPGG